MAVLDQNSSPTPRVEGGIVVSEANSGRPSKGEVEKMARRRFQNPRPKKLGKFWYIRVWQDDATGNVPTRKLKRIKVAPGSVPEREVKKIVAEIMAPINRSLVTVGSGVNFGAYVASTYRTNHLPLLAKPVQDSYQSMIDVHLEKAFGHSCLRDLTRSVLQGYFANSAGGVNFPTLLKIRDALSSNSSVRCRRRIPDQKSNGRAKTPTGQKTTRAEAHNHAAAIRVADGIDRRAIRHDGLCGHVHGLADQ